MISVEVIPYNLKFKRPAGTSRGVLNDKVSYFVKLRDGENVGYGEAGPLPRLSIDFGVDFTEKVKTELGTHVSLEAIKKYGSDLIDFPSLKFAFETALLDLNSGGKQVLFDTPFTKGKDGITINGLIWMGDSDYMLEQIEQKLAVGFDCLKMKIGAIDFDEECRLLSVIRSRFSKDSLELRVDANGAFLPQDAYQKLEKLAIYDIHSIEQPIKQDQLKEMRALCENTPIPIALDEELIGVQNKEELLDEINPQYIILKPTLVGGLEESKKWIEVAESRSIGWWMTSALESNVGLNAVAQFSSTFDLKMPQGLGTGQLFINNIDSPLEIKKDKPYTTNNSWKIEF